jgi:hypothetical protein
VRIAGHCYRELGWPLREVGALLEVARLGGVSGRAVEYPLLLAAVNDTAPSANLPDDVDPRMWFEMDGCEGRHFLGERQL